ncbi:MAG: polysaccharide pyruvyl transferase family protein [Rhodoglobus sp.]
MRLPKILRTAARAPMIFVWRLGNRTRSVGSPTGRHVLLAPPGGGNIGDQAMVEAFLGGVNGPVTVLVRGAGAFSGLTDWPDVTVMELPHLLHGSLQRSLKDARRLREHWVGASSFSVVGADVMDGAYDWPASVIRSTLAHRAALDGLDTRIIGFSWNAAPHPQAAKAMRRAADAGVRVLARDPSSEKRLVRIVPQVERTADIVFTDERQAPLPTSISSHVEGSGSFVVINASGLVARSVEQTSGYLRAVRHLIASDHRVVLLPHVIRASGDDLAACRSIWEALSERERAQVVLVQELLRPGQVRQLAARARLVVTGRMHLGVIALSQCVPAIIVATQGKVEGLMEAFDSAELVIAPAAIPEDGIGSAVKKVLGEEEVLRERILSRLPFVKELANRNLAGLT